MKLTVYELSKKYYPHLWSAERIEALYKAGKLTKEEYEKQTAPYLSVDSDEIVWLLYR